SRETCRDSLPQGGWRRHAGRSRQPCRWSLRLAPPAGAALMRLSPLSGDPVDGVEQPLLLERFPAVLNRAGPADALACQASVKGADSVTQLLGDGRVSAGRAMPD